MDGDAKLPIPTYYPAEYSRLFDEDGMACRHGGLFCRDDHVRELVEAKDAEIEERALACQTREHGAEMNVLAVSGKLAEVRAQRDRLVALFRKAWGPGCSERDPDCPACEVEAEFREITGHGFAESEEGGGDDSRHYERVAGCHRFAQLGP